MRLGAGAVALGLSLCVVSCASHPPAPLLTLEQAVASAQRSAENRARDVYRHPVETLEFFGLRSGMTVVEVWPGTGWYTEILAPYLCARGTYYAAQFPDEPQAPAYQQRQRAAFAAKLESDPRCFGRIIVTELGPPDHWQPAPAGTADLVVSFRAVHNWLEQGIEREMFAAFYRTLKHGGALGIVEHRAAPGTTRAQMVRSGYVTQDLVVRLAEEAGFRFIGWQEINANPKDTKDHPKGVWTLPPTLALGEQDRARYLAIGESDRMTVKFLKP